MEPRKLDTMDRRSDYPENQEEYEKFDIPFIKLSSDPSDFEDDRKFDSKIISENFIDTMREFLSNDAGLINEETIELLEPYLTLENFDNLRVFSPDLCEYKELWAGDEYIYRNELPFFK